MLTIKHVESNSHESVTECESTSYEPRVGDKPCILLAFGVPGWNGPAQFGNGTIFVMNDSGRTIATYRLSEDNRGIGGQDIGDPPKPE